MLIALPVSGLLKDALLREFQEELARLKSQLEQRVCERIKEEFKSQFSLIRRITKTIV